MNVAQHILTFGIRFYRWGLSPVKDVFFGVAGRCRFEPSCSAYALEAVVTHGAIKGSLLAVRRLARCHPWGAFGADPVPSKKLTLNMAGSGCCEDSHSAQLFSQIISRKTRKPVFHSVRPN